MGEMEEKKAKMPLGNAFLAKHRKEKKRKERTSHQFQHEKNHLRCEYGFKEPLGCKQEKSKTLWERAIRFHILFPSSPQ